MDPRSKAIELVHAADALILDFDGPVCDVFAGYPASEVAKELIKQVDFEIETQDPLEVLRRAVGLESDVAALDRLLTDLECLAVENARETPGMRELTQMFDGPIGIASNNASRAIQEWLGLVGLTRAFGWVEGRAPHSMKPDPRSLQLVARGIGVGINNCVFIGDSGSDVIAARSIGMAFIGLAEEGLKVELFSNQGCEATIGRMTDLSWPGDGSAPR